MAEPIKKTDIVEDNLLSSLINEFKHAKQVNDDLNVSLRESAKLIKGNLSGKKTYDTQGIKEFNAELKRSEQLFKQKLALDKHDKANMIALERLKQQEIRTQNLRNKQTEREIKNQTRLESRYARVNGWLGSLRKEYRDLAIKRELGIDLSKKEEFRYSVLEGRIQKYDGALKKVDASMGNHQRNVGNYASGFNGLNNSVNQLTREMPAFANSVGTGFMAISNNLPMFFDEISKIKKANKELIAQGKPVQSTFSKLASSVFSFGTLLSVGVTLLTVYGAEMVKWGQTLFGVSDALEEVNKRQAEFNKSKVEGRKDAQADILELKKYLAVVKDDTLEMEHRQTALKKLRSEFPFYFKDLTDSQILLGKTTEAEKELITALEKRKEIEKKTELNVENKKILIDLDIEKERLNKHLLQQEKEFDRWSKMRNVGSEVLANIGSKIRKDRKELLEIEKEFNAVTEKTIQNDADILNLKKETIALEFQGDNKDGKRNPRKFGNEEAKEQEIDLTRLIQDEQVKRIEDEQRLLITQAGLKAQRSIEDLANVKATEEQKAELTKEINLNLFNEIVAIENDYWLRRQEMIDKTVKEAEDSENAQIEDAFKRADKRLSDEAKETELSLELSSITGEEKKRIEVENEIDLLEQKISLRKKYGKDTLDLEIELAKLRGKDVKEIEKSNAKEIKEIASGLFEHQKRLSDERIKLLDKEIKAHEKQLDSFRKLAESGNITAKESLAIEQQLIVEANKKKAEEQRRQERLKFAESAFSAYASNVDKGEKNPLLKTISDMTLLRQFIASMPTFKDGTEDTGTHGQGVDGQGGFHAILHPNERVLTKEQNQKLGNISNEELALTMQRVNSGEVVNLHNGATAVSTNWENLALINEIKDLKKVIKNKPETTIQAGQIIQGAMEIAEEKRQGNTLYRNKYIVK